jgi:hypothetical protein
MLYKVEYILIPESYVRMSMKTSEFNKLIESQFDDDIIIYEYNGIRYLFFDEDLVVEEKLE